MNATQLPLVVALTGASGMVYATELLRQLLHGGREVHLIISPSAAAVIEHELGIDVSLADFDPRVLLEHRASWSRRGVPPPAPKLLQRLHHHRHHDFMTPVASGSFLTAGMIICPCSGSTLAGIAHGSSGNLVQRAAEVHLKERRKLVVVPRETPLSSFTLENMHRLSLAGATILPAAPGWYHAVQSLDDLVDFIVSRILDQFGLENQIISRWGQQGESAAEPQGTDQRGSGEQGREEPIAEEPPPGEQTR